MAGWNNAANKIGISGRRAFLISCSGAFVRVQQSPVCNQTKIESSRFSGT